MKLIFLKDVGGVARHNEVKDIAEQTDVSINTALGRMRYALINLRRMIKEKNMILC